MDLILWYLRVLPAQGNVLVDPFDHTIPMSDPETNTGEFITKASKTKASKANTGHFVIVVTAVGASVKVDIDENTDGIIEDDEKGKDNTVATANVLFPTFLAEDMHGMGNIDNGGTLSIDGMGLNLTKFEATETVTKDSTTANVGDLNTGNAIPLSFNHLTGSFTEALTSMGMGGVDQSAAWGGSPVIRPAVANTANAGLALDVDVEEADSPTNSDYQTLNGMDENSNVETQARGGRLAEKDAGGAEAMVENVVSGYVNEGGNSKDVDGTATQTINNAEEGSERMQRALNLGGLVLPALYGVSDESKHIMLMLSATDEFGGAGKYALMPAKTGYMVTLIDGMGGELADPKAAEGPVFGGSADPEVPPGTMIVVEGMRVYVDVDKCAGETIRGSEMMIDDGDKIDGPWTLGHLMDIVATGETKDFAGLDAMLMDTSSPGSIKFKRAGLDCTYEFGDGTPAGAVDEEGSDGVPITDKRAFKAGTLVIEEEMTDRTFVTTGQALVKLLTPDQTYAASWSLKSPPSPVN
jgi:hypothetical protein